MKELGKSALVAVAVVFAYHNGYLNFVLSGAKKG